MRRLMTRRSVLGGTLAFVASGCVPFRRSNSFGGKITTNYRVGDVALALAEPIYVAEARTYLVPFPPESIERAAKVYPPALVAGMQLGVVALYQKCTHLGCKVPWCSTSRWFECPCHAALFNRVGERKGGPAPRGLDHFAVVIDGGKVVIDSRQVFIGAADGTNTTGQEAEGPHCVGSVNVSVGSDGGANAPTLAPTTAA